MPPVALLVLQGIQAAITEAPQAIALIEKGKEFISQMFEAGLVTREQQNQLLAHVDNVCAALEAGTVPPGWDVQADPE